MNLTGNEAKEKICCFARNNQYKCLATECMAWRWFTTCTYQYLNKEFPVPTSRIEIPLPKDQWTGYCGLAGKIVAGMI